MIVAACVLLLVALNVFTSNAQCPANTFTCKDGSCIPQDWVGDGESDCDDASDEAVGIVMHLTAPESSTNGTLKSSSRIQIEETADDPFDNFAAKSHFSVTPPREVKPTLKLDAEVASQKCANDVQHRIDQCSADLINWARTIDEIDFSKISLLIDKNSWSQVNQGCDLITEYRTCTEGLQIINCIIPETIRVWNDADLYACQLLLPSIREHEKCFAIARDSRCDSTSGGAKVGSSPICRLISSVSADLRCVERLSVGVCDESALEVINPIQSETTHIFQQLTCAQHILPIGVPNEPNISTTECTSCANVLQTLLDVNAFCSGEQQDIWTSVRKVVCTQKQQLTKHGACFIESAKQTKCDTNPVNETICGAIEQFNNNIDCAIRVMNDVCSIDAQNVVVGIQEKLSDELISLSCYVQKTPEELPNSDGFALTPIFPRCTSDQENAALVCLVELVEVNKQLGDLQSLNFLLEISDGNSSIVNHMCQLYDKYERCLNESVFSRSHGQRCSFNSPLNTLARVGLSPICKFGSRDILQKHRDCIAAVKEHTANCQSGLGGLGMAVNFMLQGIHGEALLCKSFYQIREAFDCGEKLVSKHCTNEASKDLIQLRKLMSDVAIEEGCPVEPPTNLEEILARPMAPVANPLPPGVPHATPLVPAVGCDPVEQKKFSDCVQPLTAFQPHPLAVIRQPKQIDEACKEFRVFSSCRANVNCRPLWAEGMSAMFEFACGQGYNTFVQVRQCVRKMTTREDIRECVSVFSRGAPQLACQSSNTLLSCALPVITEKCGTIAAQFITDYVDRFAKAIDPSCKIIAKSNEGAIAGYNCTAEEQQVIQHCAAPLNELSSRIDELFEGGLQAFLANVKNLAPVFAQGCNLTVEFRECTKPILMRSSRCVVSSCLIRAGEGICDQPDTAKAIDDNLSCVFKQGSNVEFGKCLRTTIATLKTFTLTALRTVLPRFINCIETIVIKQCGQTSLHLLKAISTSDICPLEIMSPQLVINVPPSSPINVCTPDMHTKHIACTGDFFRKYRMLPIAIINDASDISQLCQQVDAISTCSLRACEENNASALRSMLQLMCARKVQFEKHVICLASVATSEQGAKCLTTFLTSTAENRCIALSSNAECAAPLINEACGSEALTLSFDAMNQYAQQLNSSCSISVPSVSLSTGCSEADLVEYLECETFIDRFAFNPLSFIRNATYFDEFCASSIDYKQCVTNMTCKFEPISSSNIALFETVCTNTDIRPHIECLTQYAKSNDGQKCIEPYSRVDLLAKDAPHKLCSALSVVLSCASESIERECGVEALKKVHAIDSLWSQHFDAACVIRIDSISKEGSQKPEVDFSSDAKPTEISQEMSTKADAGAVQNEAANPEPSPEPESSTESRSFSVSPASQPEPEPKLPNDKDGQQVSGPNIESKPQPTSANNEASPEPIPEPTTQSGSNPSAEPKPEIGPQAEPEPTNITNNRTKGCERSNPSAILFGVFAVFVLRI